MKMHLRSFAVPLLFAQLLAGLPLSHKPHAGKPVSSSDWAKSPANPVLGGDLGTCFDACVLKEGKTYRMWFSWRPRKSIALSESVDGVHWSAPEIVLGPNSKTDWEEDINRPGVVKRADGYHMWYTGQARGRSWIGYATSKDGRAWNRESERPVLSADRAWEKAAVMCPDVMWEPRKKVFRMWYSGGEQYEPDAIGYAESADGIHWTKNGDPIFQADPSRPWEQHKVTACNVVANHGWHYLFYIGFRDVDHAQIGLARSRDGVSAWERFAGNPIVRPTEGSWDSDACYKPTVVRDGDHWLLWYNGRKGGVEQIGLAIHHGRDLWLQVRNATVSGQKSMTRDEKQGSY
jgi:predicted GH43/DUF377 family glycosyl hydrolase